ncbi:MAG: hypothetical protein JHD02_01640 [Thermoleophilaceae bacterium]|nr:hypothetical protein [Thermoleophilaceae bacterium]
MKTDDLNKQIDALKRGAMDVARDMHARKLAIPAAALLVAIVAAVMVLPKASTPTPPPPTADLPAPEQKVVRVAQVSLIEGSSLGEEVPLANSEDPFAGSGDGYDCTRVGSSEPKVYDCKVADLKVRIICTAEAGSGPCSETEGATGSASGSTDKTGESGGSTSGTGESGGGKSGGGDSGGNSGGSKTVYYTVTVSLDGTTKKNVVAGDELPESDGALVVYAGTNDAHDKAVFIASDGVVPSGVPVDATFGSFTLKKGETATLTDVNGAEHKLTLKSISKVTK